MFRPISGYSFNLFLSMVISVTALSQKKIEKPDTVKNRYLPTGLRIGTDAISIIKTKITSNFKGWEVNGDLDFDRYYLAVDYGNWARNEVLHSSVTNLVNGQYNNSGNYYRIGGDVNFMLKDPEKNMFFLGFRYGTSNFRESLSYHYSDSLPGIKNFVDREVSVSHSGLIAHWVELTTGLRIKVWGPFWMGYTARLKIAPSVKGAKQFNPFDIPGYGLAEKTNYWGINYQLFWRFPVRKIK